MGRSLHKRKSRVSQHKRRSAANVALAKRSRPKTGHKARPTLKQLAKEFAREGPAAGKRALTPLQRRMISGGA